MIREQVGSLGQEIAVVQSDLKDLKADWRRSIVEMERHFRESDSNLAEEKGVRVALIEALEHGVRQSKDDMLLERQQRAAADETATARMESIREQLQGALQERSMQEAELRQFMALSGRAAEQFEALTK